MTCETSEECVQPASMWVQPPKIDQKTMFPIPSCVDCGPQLGYKILAPLEPSSH